MKHVLIFFATSLLAVFSVAAQNDPDASPNLSDVPSFDSLYPERIVYEMYNIDQPPKYPGGEKELLKYLAENIKYPAADRDNNIGCPMIALTFIVEADGSISDKKVIRNDGPFAQSVLKLVGQMPRWSPGMKNGEAVAVRFRLPVRVCLE